MTLPPLGMYFGNRACAPVSGAALALVPSFSWQLVQRMFDCTYLGRLSGVNLSSARPRRMAAPIESAGISCSVGGFHAVSSNETAELPGGAGAGARSSVHAPSIKARRIDRITDGDAIARQSRPQYVGRGICR